jgi:predicted transcriptional regulator of viral defense system
MQKNYLLSWIEELQARGWIAFAIKDVMNAFPDKSENALIQSLSRLSQKGKIVPIYKGFYLIIPAEYTIRKIVPPVQFIDYLMEYIGKPYYVGLLSAAALHGAAHQQPQEFFVLTTSKQLATYKKGMKINYVIKSKIPSHFIEDKKTQTGYIKVSSPELTALDLIYYNLRVGGMNRVATVLSELVESMHIEKIVPDLINLFSTPTIQRLGYLFESVLEETEFANKLYSVSDSLNLKFFRQPLRTGMKSTGYVTDPRWKIIINTEIEPDI